MFFCFSKCFFVFHKINLSRRRVVFPFVLIVFCREIFQGAPPKRFLLDGLIPVQPVHRAHRDKRDPDWHLRQAYSDFSFLFESSEGPLDVESTDDARTRCMVRFLSGKHLEPVYLPNIQKASPFRHPLKEEPIGANDQVLRINEQDEEEKRTLLHYAVLGGCDSLTIKLLDLGASFDIRDIYGHTVLEYAAMFSPSIVGILLRYGDDPSRQSEVTAWQYAVWFNQYSAFENLYWQICELDNRVERFTNWHNMVAEKWEYYQKSTIERRDPLFHQRQESTERQRAHQRLRHLRQEEKVQRQKIRQRRPKIASDVREHQTHTDLADDIASTSDPLSGQTQPDNTPATTVFNISLAALHVSSAEQEVDTSMPADSIPSTKFEDMSPHQQSLKSFASDNAIHSADGQYTDSEGRTILHYVARFSPVPEEIGMALARGADIDGQDLRGFTALHYAAFYGNVRVLPALLQAGADVNKKSSYGLTPLHMAARCSPETCELMDQILGHYEVTKGQRRNPICFHDIRSLQRSQSGKKQNADSWGYSDEGRWERNGPSVVEIFIKGKRQKLEINAQDAAGCSALLYAMNHAEFSEVERCNNFLALSAFGADPNLQNNQGNTAMHFCAAYASVKVLKELERQKVTFKNIRNKKGETPLHFGEKHIHEGDDKYIKKRVLQRMAIDC